MMAGKTMIVGAAGLLMAGLVAGCSPKQQGEQVNAMNGVAATDFADRMTGAAPSAPEAKPFEISEKTDLLEFSYAYPAQAAAVPALADKFGKDLARSRADATGMARQDSKAAKEAGYPFRGHSLETRWTVSADTPRFLALTSTSYVFTGGAHGMTGYSAVLWDRARKRETSLTALMTSPPAFASAIRGRFCDTLDKQRAQKRGAPVVRGDDDFTNCIDPMKETLVPTSKDGKLVDGIMVIVGPYSAGPYAEGSYEVPLPVDKAMLGAIKTEYQDAFAGGAEG
ncbi:MAG: DUF4163 domain-containing protein [Sphingobium sp.]